MMVDYEYRIYPLLTVRKVQVILPCEFQEDPIPKHCACC